MKLERAWFVVNSFHHSVVCCDSGQCLVSRKKLRRIRDMGELKSAWELALEKAKKMGGEEAVSLSSNQKAEIAEIRKIYAAKIAEVEILIQDKEKREREPGITAGKRPQDRIHLPEVQGKIKKESLRVSVKDVRRKSARVQECKEVYAFAI
jgi:hypothetical protein